MAPTVDKHARRVANVPDARLHAKALADGEQDNGWLEGYAAVWGNVDLLGEQMVRGCFARSIAQAVPAGTVKLMTTHYRDGGDVLESIGTITEAREDDYGLWIHADFEPTPTAQEVRGKVLRGDVKFLSVGFYAIQVAMRDMTPAEAENVMPARRGEPVRMHTESKLLEVTVTVKPVNSAAAITDAKSLPADASQGTGSAQPAAITAALAPPPASHATRRDLEGRRRRLRMLIRE